MSSKTRFSWRAFTSLYITLSFIIIIVSGIILYIAPPGRIAKWAYIPIFGLEKDQWQALHTIFTFLFIIANGFHLYFNWNSFISYLKNKKSKVFKLRRELISTFFITAGIFYLVILNVQPFKSVMIFGESMKNDWSVEKVEPPVPHAEEMTISELAKMIDQEPETLISNLERQNIVVDKNSVIKEIAQKYALSPQQIFEKLQIKGKDNTLHQGAKKGYGRMSVQQVCNDHNIPVEDAIRRLREIGIEANAESVLRDLGKAGNKTPNDIVKIIENIKEK